MNDKLQASVLLKKIIRKIRGKYRPRDIFLSFAYQRHNQRRLEHLASLGLEIAGASVMEVGAGIGDHTSFFLDRGCKVVSTDARQENLAILKTRYPNLEVRYLDLDNPPDTFSERFDIVYCYGLLYHLTRPGEAIDFMSQCCKKMLLLETAVSFGDAKQINLCEEAVQDPSQSFSGLGCRPSRRWVYDKLKENFEFVYLPLTQPNHEEFPLDWTAAPTAELSRSIFIASRPEIKSANLVEDIPNRQVRH